MSIGIVLIYVGIIATHYVETFLNNVGIFLTKIFNVATDNMCCSLYFRPKKGSSHSKDVANRKGPDSPPSNCRYNNV